MQKIMPLLKPTIVLKLKKEFMRTDFPWILYKLKIAWELGKTKPSFIGTL